MGVNRFNQPREAQHEQPYVSQYVALPFEQYARNLQGKQNTWDTAEKTHGEILGANIDAIDYEQEQKNALLNQYVEHAHKLVDEHGGDYGQLSGRLGSLKSHLKGELEKGRLAQFEQNLKAKQEHDKLILANDKMDAEAKHHAIAQSDADFKLRGGSLEGVDFNGRGGYDSTAPARIANEVAKNMTAQTIEDATHKGFRTYIDGGNVIQMGKDGSKTVILSKDTIAKNVAYALQQNPEAMSAINRRVSDTEHTYKGHYNSKGELIYNFNDYKSKKAQDVINGLATSMGGTYQRNDYSHTTDDSFLTSKEGSGPGGLSSKSVPEISINRNRLNDREYKSFTDTYKEKTQGFGSVLHTKLANEILKYNPSLPGANTANVLYRNILGVPSNHVLSEKDKDRAAELIAKGDATVINKLGKLNADQKASIVNMAAQQVAEKHTAEFKDKRLTEQAVRYLSPQQREALNSKEEPVWKEEPVYTAEGPGYMRKVNVNPKAQAKADAQEALNKQKDILDKREFDSRGTIPDQYTGVIGQPTKTKLPDGSVRSTGQINLQDLLRGDHIAAGKSIFNMTVTDPVTKKQGSLLEILGPSDYSSMKPGEQKIIQDEILKSAKTSKTMNDDGTYNMVFEYGDKPPVTIPVAYDKHNVTGNGLTIHTGLPGKTLAQMNTEGRLNNIKAKITQQGEMELPHTSLFVKSYPSGEMELYNSHGKHYHIDSDSVEAFLQAYSAALNSSDPALRIKHLEQQFKKEQGL